MPRILIENADILALDGEDRVLRKTDLAIDGKTIVALGRVPADFVADERIDARDQLALPGFFNAHTHAAMTLQRGLAEDLDIVRWVNERIWVMESALTSGVMREGAEADLSLVNMNQAHLMPPHDLAAKLVHSARGGDLALVIVDGKILLRDGELTTLDEEKIKRESELRAFRMAQSDLKRTQTYMAKQPIYRGMP
jgi:cytosine/adenosine deaminase-related metal-dependent hydrolase